MRALVIWAAAAAIVCARPAAAATYTTDKSYQFTGQSNFNTGDGVAVNPADTRLYVVVSSTTTGGVRILDTTSGAQVGTFTPPSPTRIRDIALSPDGSTLYFLRDTDTAWTLEFVTAADGNHGPADVTPIDAAPGEHNQNPVPLTEPRSLAVTESGGNLYIGVAARSYFFLYRRTGTNTWTQEQAIPLPVTSQRRDVTAADTGSGPAFFVLTPGAQSTPSVRAFNLDGTERSVTFAALPSAFQGYFFDSITAGGTVDGEPSLFLAADNIDENFNSVLSVFRYTTAGAFTGDGFGYALSQSGPLSQLGALGQDTLFAPGAVSGEHFYIGAINPNEFNGGPQYTRVEIGNSTGGPGSLSGKITSGSANVEGVRVVIAGRDTPVDTTDADGEYSLSPLNAGSYTIGASKFGYAAASADVSLAAGEEKTNVNLVLPGPVPGFTVGYSFAPPVIDGQIFPGEYNAAPMPLYRLGGADPAAAVAATAWATHDGQNLYIAVSAGEPSLALNSAAWSNQNMLTFDDTVQIYVDPAHRHDVPGSQPNLYQFAVNIPPVIGGVPNGTSQRIARRINPDGSFAQSVDNFYWFARAGYSETGWMLEARISLDAFAFFGLPDASSVWGLLIGRSRPSSHNDALPTLYSTSPAQTVALTRPNTWTDVTFEQPVTGVDGDVNQNGRVDLSDALFTLRMAAGLSFGAPAPGDPNPDDPNLAIRQGILARGNVWPPSPDGKITLEDALRLIRAANGKDTL